MTNSSYIEKNNRGVDALYAGDLPRGYQILSQVFFECVKNRHTAHQLKMESRGVKTSVEFALQDCSRGLLRSIEATRGLSRPGDVHGDPSGSRTFLALNFLRIEIPAGSTEQVNDLCSCAVAWALGHNLSIIYALMGFQRQSSCGQGRTLLSKALRTLQPIKRQILFQSSTSPFWTNLKLSILNNYVCIARECGKSVGSVLVDMRAMEKLLVQSRAHVDPVDLRKFYLSLQFMNVCTTVASAA